MLSIHRSGVKRPACVGLGAVVEDTTPDDQAVLAVGITSITGPDSGVA